MDTRHPDEGTIHAYVDGQLDAGEHRRVEEHIAACGRCAAAAAEARGLVVAASRIVGALDGVPANVVPVSRRRRRTHWLAAAAVLLFGAGVTSVITRSTFDATDSAQLAADPAAPVADAEFQRPDSRTGEPGDVGRASISAAASRERSLAVPKTPGSTPQRQATSNRPVERVTRDAASDYQILRAPVETPAAAAALAPAPPAAPTLRTELADESGTVITGRVMSSEGRPVAHARVNVAGLNIAAATDSAGAYRIVLPSRSARGDSATVFARAIGHARASKTISTDRESQALDFELQAEQLALEEVVVTSSDARRGERSRTAAAAQAGQATAAAKRSPLRTVRYEVTPGVEVELREFGADGAVPDSHTGRAEYRWRNAEGTRLFVLSGPFTVAQLESLARRLAELKELR